MDTARRRPRRRDATRAALKCHVCAPSHISDDLADARNQVRWFGAMVSNPRHGPDRALRLRVGDPGCPHRVRAGAEVLRLQGSQPRRAAHGEFVTDEICDRFCVLGTPEQATRKLKELESLGVDHFNIYLMTHGQEETLAAYRRRHPPAVRAGRGVSGEHAGPGEPPRRRPLDCADPAALLGKGADVCAPSPHDRPRGRGRRGLRDPVRHGDHVPSGRALRAGGDPLGLGAPPPLLPAGTSTWSRRSSMVDLGDLPVAPGDTVETYRRVEAALAPRGRGRRPRPRLGGDHSVTLAELRVLAAAATARSRSSSSTRTPTRGTSTSARSTSTGRPSPRAVEEGSSTRRVRHGRHARNRLRGRRPRRARASSAHRRLDRGAARPRPAGYGDLVRERVGGRRVFLSFDVDFLDPSVAPGTGTPEIGGFTTAEALAFLRSLRGPARGADVVEVAPAYDGPGQRTALAAANVAWELLALHGGAPGLRVTFGQSRRGSGARRSAPLPRWNAIPVSGGVSLGLGARWTVARGGSRAGRRLDPGCWS